MAHSTSLNWTGSDDVGMKISHLFARFAEMRATAKRRSRDRDFLATISDRDLRDAGLTRSGLAFEINKPFWRT